MYETVIIYHEIILAKYKDYSYEQTVLLPVSFSNQILPGTFEYTLNSVIDDLDLSIFRNGLQMIAFPQDLL
jgi:hypothetical protein